MAANGNLIFQDTNKATFVGANSNVVIDTVHASLGVGVDVNGPTSNLHVVGNCFVSTDFTASTLSGNGSGLTALNAANVTTGTLDRNTTGSAATLTTPRTIGGVNFDGSADIVPTTFGAATFDTDTLVVDSVNDRVGIGTMSPQVDLEIENVNGSPELRFTDPFSGSTAAWDARSNVLGEISWYSRDSQFTDSYGKVASITSKHFDDGWPDGALCFTTSSNGILNEDAMVIDQTGKVGIGTDAPVYKLDVDGEIQIRGQGLIYHANETSDSEASRFFLRFNKTLDASYPMLCNRAPNGDVVIATGTSSGGNDVERMRFNGGDGTRDIEVTNANFIVSGNLTAGTIDASKISNATVGDSTGGVKAVYFENTENDGIHYTDKNGILAFDENFKDTEYGTGIYNPDATFVGGDGGGLLIKNQDGWGAIFTSVNTRWAKGYWNSLDVSGGVTASSFTTSGLTVSTFLGVAPGFESEFIYTKGLVNQNETGTGPAAIIFGNGSTTGSDQISLITSGSTRLYINSSGSVTLGNGNAVTSDDRIKFNEENISNALVLIDRIKPQKYEKIACVSVPQYRGTWIPTDEEWENVKEDYEYNDEFGFIAQDVRNVPELAFLVKGEETRIDTMTLAPEEYSNLAAEEQETYTQTLDGYTKQIETQTPLSLNYQGLFVVAIGAIKELKAENDSIKARLDALENA